MELKAYIPLDIYIQMCVTMNFDPLDNPLLVLVGPDGYVTRTIDDNDGLVVFPNSNELIMFIVQELPKIGWDLQDLEPFRLRDCINATDNEITLRQEDLKGTFELKSTREVANGTAYSSGPTGATYPPQVGLFGNLEGGTA